MSEYDTTTREVPEFAPSVVDTRTIDGTRVSIVEHHAARVDADHEPVVSGTRYEALIADAFTLRPPTVQVYVNAGRSHEAGDYAGGQWSRAVDLSTSHVAASLGGSETVAGAVTAAKRGLKKAAQLAQYGPVAERNIATFTRDEFAEFAPDQPIAVGDLVVIQSHGRYRLGVAVAVTAKRVEALVATPSGQTAQGASAARSAVRRYTKTRAERAADVAATVEAYTGDAALDAQARATHVQATLDRIEADVLAERAAPAAVPAPEFPGELVGQAAALIDAAQLCAPGEAQRGTRSLRNPEKFFYMPADVAAAAIHAPRPAAGQVIGVIVCMWPGGGDAKCAKVGPFDSPAAAGDWWAADFNRFAELSSFVVWPAESGTTAPAGDRGADETTGDAGTQVDPVDDSVWMSTARRGVDYHRPGAERDGYRFTTCDRSMRTGTTMRRLNAVEVVGARPCPRCYPATAQVTDPAAQWVTPAGEVAQLADGDLVVLRHVVAGRITTDSRFGRWVYVGAVWRGVRDDEARAFRRLATLGMIVPGDVAHHAVRDGFSSSVAPYTITTWRPLDDTVTALVAEPGPAGPLPPAPVIHAPDGIEPAGRRRIVGVGVPGLVVTVTPDAPDRSGPGVQVFAPAHVEQVAGELADRADQPLVTRALLKAAAAGGAGVRILVDLGTAEGEAWVRAQFPLDAEGPDVSDMTGYDTAETDYLLRVVSYGLSRDVASTGPGPWRDRLVALVDLVWSVVTLLDAGRADLAAQMTATIASPDLARWVPPTDPDDEQVWAQLSPSGAGSLLTMWILDGADWKSPPGEGDGTLRELVDAGLVEPDERQGPRPSGRRRWRPTALGARVAESLTPDESVLLMCDDRPHPPTRGGPCPDWCPLTHLITELLDRFDNVDGVPFEHDGVVYPGYVAGMCGHRVAQSEWRAGLRACERCPAPPPRPAILDEEHSDDPQVEVCGRCGDPIDGSTRSARDDEWCLDCRVEVQGDPSGR